MPRPFTSGLKIKLAYPSRLVGLDRDAAGELLAGQNFWTPAVPFLLATGEHDVPAGAGVAILTTDINHSTATLSVVVWREGERVIAMVTSTAISEAATERIRGLPRFAGEVKPGEAKPLWPSSLLDNARPLPAQPTRWAWRAGEPQPPEAEPVAFGKTCPKCGTGTLVAKEGRFGAFLGCDAFPKCDYIAKDANGKTIRPSQDTPQDHTPHGDTPMTPTAAAPAPADARLAALQALLAPTLDEDRVRTLATEVAEEKVAVGVAAAVTELGAKVLTDAEARIEALLADEGRRITHVQVAERAPVAIGGQAHFLLPELTRRSMMRDHKGARFNHMLVGDAGTGKSTLASQVAKALGLAYGYLNCSAGVTESRLIGRMTPNLQTGAEQFNASQLLHFYEVGGVYCLDEMDGLDENASLALNGLIDATFYTTPDGRTIARHADFILMATANTYGTGASRKFSGRTQLDAAYLDRWLVLSVDYDEALERSLVASRPVVAKLQAARKAMREKSMNRWVTTRAMLRADAMVGQMGKTPDEAIRAALDGWSAADLAAVGLA